MLCAHCSNPALFIYEITPDVNVKYCDNHLPRFLEPRKKAGLLKTTDEWQKGLEDISQTLAVPSTVSEPQEEVVSEEVAPAKKRPVKKTTK